MILGGFLQLKAGSAGTTDDANIHFLDRQLVRQTLAFFPSLQLEPIFPAPSLLSKKRGAI